MISFCSKCNINWSRLHVLDGAGDHQYEVCPLCRSDFFLQPATDIISYIMCPISGKIINVDTKEILLLVPVPVVPYKQEKKKVWDETYEDFEERYYAEQDRCIEAGSFKDGKRIIRKHHFEKV